MRVSNNTAVVMNISNRSIYDNRNVQNRVAEVVTNQTKAQIQGTGKFVRSFGGAGTLQHIDVIV